MALTGWFDGLLNWFRGGYYYGETSGSFDGSVAIAAMDAATRMCAYAVSRGNVMLDGSLAEYWTPELTRTRFMQLLVRDLLYEGNAAFEIDATAGAGKLHRAGYFEVRGKNILRYRLELHRPDGQTTRNLAADAVCHVKMNDPRETPWYGVGYFAGNELIRHLERQLIQQGSWPAHRLYTMPGPEFASAKVDGGDAEEHDQELAADRFAHSGLKILRNLNSRGGPIPVPKTEGIFGPDKEAVVLRQDLVDEVFSSVGIPPTLRGDSVPGMAYTTALSAWIDGFLQPMADAIAEQLTDALAVNVTIDLSPAKVPSVVDQGKALNDLVGAGMPYPEAKEAVGL